MTHRSNGIRMIPQLTKQGERWGLTLLLLFLFGLLVHNLGRFSLHLDEVSSYLNSSTWAGLRNGLQESGGNRILFYLLLNRWVQLGDQELWQRLLSSFFAFLTFPVFYRLARRLMPVSAAVYALLLFGINTVYLDFARLSRNYALAIFFAILSYYLLLTLLQRKDEYQRLRWVAYAVCSLCLLLAHPVGLFALVAQGGVLLFLPLLPRPFPWRPLILSATLVVATFFLLPLLFGDAPNSQLDWLQIPDFGRIFTLIVLFLGGTQAAMTVIAILICGLVLLLPRYARRLRADHHFLREQWPLFLILSWLVIHFVLMLLVTYFYQPIFQPRYLLLLLPAAMLLLAKLLFSLKSPLLSLLLGAVLTFFLLQRAFDLVVTLTKPQWEAAVGWVIDEGDESDAVLFFDYHGQRVYRYYAERHPFPSAAQPQIVELSSEPYHPGGGSLPAPFDAATLQSLSAEHPAVWFVVFNNNIHGEYSYNLFLDIQQGIEQQYEQIDGIDFNGPFVARYTLKADQ